MSFLERASRLPSLGIGVSTEYGASASDGTLDVMRLRREHPEYAGFLEIGVEVTKGLDSDDRAWIASGGQTTYHFLDVNLDDPRDQTPAWLEQVQLTIDEMNPAWMCGDAGLWHFGPRDRAQMTLLPPILCDDAARELGDGVRALRDATNLEVLPENPPGSVYLGDLHLLDFFSRVLDQADTGMLLDCAHLAIHQRLCGHSPLTGLDAFPVDRIIEMHIAGGVERERDGFKWVEDDHTPEVLPDTWMIFEYLVERATHLKAVVFECERNPMEACLDGFSRIDRAWNGRVQP